MRSLRGSASALIGLVALVLIGGAGFYLARTQAETRAAIVGGFDERVRLAAGLTGDTLGASDPKTRAWAVAAFAGPAAGLNAALTSNLDASTPWLIVLGSDGTGLGAAPAAGLGRAAALQADPGFRLALRSGRLTFGDVAKDQGHFVVYAFQPFPVAGGRRVLVVPTVVDSLGLLLRSALNVTGSASYVVDSVGNVLVSSGPAVVGAPMPTDRGRVGDNYYAGYPVGGSSWRVITVVRYADLLAPVRAAEHSAWLIFAGFACAVLLMLVVGAAMVISSARLAESRRHDPLTGLPNRSLFLQHAEAAVAQRQPLTALFLDLDGFKPVNDTYGHAAGDALLKLVAQRLVAVTRPEDHLSRFGGDEFLVLCPGTGDDADAVADRLLDHLSEPYDVDGCTVNVGVSIGIAVSGPHAESAESLIRRADLALYRAKNNGRNRIEHFVPDMASV